MLASQKGLKLVAAKMTTATKELLADHYAELTEKKLENCTTRQHARTHFALISLL